MAKDILTAKFTIKAYNFATVQAIRRVLANEHNQTALVAALENTISYHLRGKIGGEFEIDGNLNVSKVRKTKKGPRNPIPKVKDGVLTWYDPEADQTNVVGKVGSAEWYKWLDEETSFRYISKDKATFTAMKRKDGKWYAHKRLNGKLKRRYLGVARSVTLKKMDKVAFELAQREIG